MAEIPYKLYINADPGRKGKDIATGLESSNYGIVLPSTNTPFSYREATPEETQTYINSKQQEYEKLGSSSGLVLGTDKRTGQQGYMTQTAIDYQNSTPEGTPMTLPSGATVYAPTGSAAALKQDWTNPVTGQASPAGTGLPSAVNGIYIENEADLQSKREELAKAGVPMSEWSKYITNVGGKLYYGQPATLTSPTGERKVVASGSSEASQLLDSGWTLGNKVGGGTIDTKLLTPEEPLNISTGGTSNLYNSDTATASATATSKSTDELIKYYQDLLTPKESDLSKQVSELLGDVSEGADSLTGRGAAQLAEEQKRGIEAKNAALASANTQLKTKLAEIDALTASYQQANQAEEGRPQTLSRLQGAQAQNYKLYLAQKNSLASEAGLIQANILGLQGELQAAQDAADRAVQLAYADKESSYNAKLAQLNILQPQLEKEEKRYATALQMVLQQQSEALAEAKANQKMQTSTVLSLMTEYLGAGINLNDTVETATAKANKYVNSQIITSGTSGTRVSGTSGGGSGSNVITGGGQVSDEAQSWVDLINAGKATISNVPAKLKTEVAQGLQSQQAPATQTKEQVDAQQKIDLIDSLLTSKGLNSAVGPSDIARGKIFGIPFGADYYTGANAQFIGGVEQLISQDTLQTLLDLKKGGGTLGALSDQERIMLKSAASKIGNWAITDKNGKVIGYNIDQKSFIAELNRLKSLAQKALGNSVSPEIQTMPDGTRWRQNPDGTYTQV